LIKIFKAFLLTLAVVLPISWASRYPGEVKILWNGFFIETSVIASILLVILMFFIIFILYKVYYSVRNLPQHLNQINNKKKLVLNKTILKEITLALITNDYKELDKNSRKLKKTLDEKIFSTYLLAKSSIIKNDFNSAEKYLNILSKTDDGKFIGLRGLAEIALKKENHETASEILNKAYKLNPNDEWVSENLSNQFAKLQKWNEAAKVLENTDTKNSRILDKKASLLVKSGKSYDIAWKISNNIIPVAINMIKINLEKNKENEALKIIKISWNNLQYQPMIDIFMLRHNRSEKDLMRKYKKITKTLKPFLKLDETKFAMAQASFNVSLWAQTNKYLKMIDDTYLDKRITDLWNSLSRESNGIKVPEFPKKLNNDPSWLCKSCGSSVNEWKIECNVCGKIGEINWSKSLKNYKVENSSSMIF